MSLRSSIFLVPFSYSWKIHNISCNLHSSIPHFLLFFLFFFALSCVRSLFFPRFFVDIYFFYAENRLSCTLRLFHKILLCIKNCVVKAEKVRSKDTKKHEVGESKRVKRKFHFYILFAWKSFYSFARCIHTHLHTLTLTHKFTKAEQKRRKKNPK